MSLSLLPRRLEFIPPRLQVEEGEWERLPEDERNLQLIELGLHTGVGEVTFKPLVWSMSLPKQEGFYFRRRPGAARITWKVLEVWEIDGALVAGWTDIVTRPLSTYTGWEFCRIQEPT